MRMRTRSIPLPNPGAAPALAVQVEFVHSNPTAMLLATSELHPIEIGSQ